MGRFQFDRQTMTYIFIAAVAVIIGWAVLRTRKANPAAAQAASGTVNGQPKKEVVYIPTSETYINSTSNESNSNNTQSPITTTGSNHPPIGPGSPPPVIQPPVNNPPPSSGTGASGVDPHAPRDKPANFTVETAGGWWHAPGADSPGDPHWLQRTGHFIAHGFGSEYWTSGAGAKYGGPVSEEYRDASSNAVRQDFENGTMYWQSGSDPANYDVKWVAKGMGGVMPSMSVMPHHLTQPSGPPRFAAPTHLAVTQEHTVQYGETLTSIGSRYGVDWQKIYRANQNSIDAASHAQGHPIPGGPWNNIVAGMKLAIPAG